MTNKSFLGIDLGTSAIKLLLVTADGVQKRAKYPYQSPDAAGWCAALRAAIAELSPENLCGIGLSSQVGTYITDAVEVLGWDSSAGKEELEQIKAAVSPEEWLSQIGMPHPDLISYPLPRLLYLKRKYPHCKAVVSPKELLIRELTGQTVTDIFTWRGLCHAGKRAYAQDLLDRFDIDLTLPRLALPTDLAGRVTAAAAQIYGLPQDTPVYVGCNDFFAGLLGMGVWDEGSIFELSGTSAHLGVITEDPVAGTFVSGPYFNGNATYGGTKSSGVSCDFAIRQFGITNLEPNCVFRDPPIFLPYLKGERAPIYSENAKGVFFGITDKTSAQDMAYAVLEGVVFSLYHIGHALPLSPDTPIITGGGSAANPLMAQLKAALFGRPVLRVEENDASALGAAILAMAGSGAYASPAEAAKAVVRYEIAAMPDLQLQAQLRKRFDIYKDLYHKLSDSFAAFSALGGNRI